jgi:hypothetical protein
MTFKRILIPLLCAVLLVLAWQSQGWAGVALVAGLLVMWLLLHVTRLMTVFKRAANRPVGYVDSAVMLNAKLKVGMPMIHVLALTRSLGELKSEAGAQPELYRWCDNGDSHVDCQFQDGRVTTWMMHRPAERQAAAEPAPASIP